MKKILTLLLIAGCSVSGLYAQAPTTAKAMLELFRKHTAAIGPAFAPTPALKGTAGGERVSAEADYNDLGSGVIFTDSARFIYSGTRHSRFDYNGFQYISLPLLDQSTNPDFLFIEATPTNLDSAGLPLAAFDTLHHYILDTLTGRPYRRHTEFSTFNADTSFSTIDNRSLLSSGTLDFGRREVILYNAGRIAKVYELLYFSSGRPDTISVRSITYNGTGNVLLDSIAQDGGGGLMPVERNSYTYNAGGLYTTRTQLFYTGVPGTFDTANRITNTFYPNGQLRTMTYEWPGGANGYLQKAFKDSVTYTAGVPGYTGLYEEDYDDTGAVLFRYKFLTNRITAGKKDSVTLTATIIGVDQDIISLKLDFNAAGNPVKGTQYDLQNGPRGTVSAYRRWYYEPITSSPGVGVKPVSTASVSIAPNPTTGIVTLHYEGAGAGMPVTVRVTNMAGQIVHAESLVLHGTRQQILLGSEATPGQYLISVQDAGGNVLCSRKIVKE